MKNLLTLSMIAVLSIALTFTSCKKDDDNNTTNSGTAVVGENTATFSKGALEFYGLWGQNTYNFDIYLASSGIDIANETGSGDLLYFELFTSTDTFNGGTFTYSFDQLANTFDNGYLIINGNWETEIAENYYEIQSGTLTVTKSGNSYDISYALMSQEKNPDNYQDIGDPVAMTGSYSGTLKYYDYSFKNTVKEKRSFIKK